MTQRQPRARDDGFLRFLRKKPCCSCGCPAPSEAGHIRMSCTARGKRATGMQEKPDDKWAVPLCSLCHRKGPESQHNVGEEKFWYCRNVDPFLLAINLYAEYGGTGGITTKPKRRTTIKPKGFGGTRKIQGRAAWPKRKLRTRSRLSSAS